MPYDAFYRVPRFTPNRFVVPHRRNRRVLGLCRKSFLCGCWCWRSWRWYVVVVFRRVGVPQSSTTMSCCFSGHIPCVIWVFSSLKDSFMSSSYLLAGPAFMWDLVDTRSLWFHSVAFLVHLSGLWVEIRWACLPFSCPTRFLCLVQWRALVAIILVQSCSPLGWCCEPGHDPLGPLVDWSCWHQAFLSQHSDE